MIIGILLSGIFAVLYAITSPLRLLADVSLPAGLASAVSTANGYISSFNAFLPLSTMITILGLVFGIELLIISYRIIVWVITKIPGISN